jgi:hypothetical protein
MEHYEIKIWENIFQSLAKYITPPNIMSGFRGTDITRLMMMSFLIEFLLLPN